MVADWRAMAMADLDAVLGIAARVHPDNPESREALASRLDLFPAGCRILDHQGRAVGYAFANPALSGRPPPLDAVLRPPAEAPDCLHLHDVAVMPDWRGGGWTARYLDAMRRLAAEMGLKALCLVAVNGTVPYWTRHGFAAVTASGALAEVLASYGGGGTYMTADIR